MEPLHLRCAGIDVHKKTAVVCVRVLDEQGRPRQQVRTFGTMTSQLQALADWLAENGVTHVGMESTGVYWKPIFNLLEGRFTVVLANAQHLRRVPGRKTDVKDCEWIAQLLQAGLLPSSFVPPTWQRELRDLTRQRTQLVREQAKASQRIQKVLEDANIKLGAVASDVLGASGRAMLRQLIAGERNADRLAELAQGRLRQKLPELREALTGRVTEHHRFLLQTHLDHLTQLEGLIERLSARIQEVLRPFAEISARLDSIPGVDRRTAEVVLAEAGPDMSRFATAQNLTAWAGVCPGNHESAGKRRSGRVRQGNVWLRAALVQAAWGASRTKTYLGSLFRRLRGRRGEKRAALAVAHSILVSVYSMLKRGTRYQDLGIDYLDRLHTERLTRQLVKRLERLGHKVTLEQLPAA